MRVLVFLLAVMLLPAQAFALSCVRPSVERSFDQVNAAPEPYVVVMGRLTLDTRKMPKTGDQTRNPRKMTQVPGTLTGKSLGLAGFKVPFDQDITLQVGCIGPWCGSAQNGAEVLAFVRREGQKYVLDVSPCGGRMFGTPKRAMIRKLQQCLKAGSCQ